MSRGEENLNKWPAQIYIERLEVRRGSIAEREKEWEIGAKEEKTLSAKKRAKNRNFWRIQGKGENLFISRVYLSCWGCRKDRGGALLKCLWEFIFVVEDLKFKKSKVRVIELKPLIMWRVIQLGKLFEKVVFEW